MTDEEEYGKKIGELPCPVCGVPAIIYETSTVLGDECHHLGHPAWLSMESKRQQITKDYYRNLKGSEIEPGHLMEPPICCICKKEIKDDQWHSRGGKVYWHDKCRE